MVTSKIPNVHLNLSNRPENVSIVLEVLIGIAEMLGLDALESDDLATAVTEACKNVVHHAYDGGEGPLEVGIHTLQGALDVVVRDHGTGIRPRVGERTQPHTGIGLPIVHALTQQVGFTNLDGGGTEVRMRFTAPGVAALEPLGDERPESCFAAEDELASTVEMAFAPVTVARAVLPRVLSALAVRAGFSSDRVSDIRRFASTLAANAGEEIGASHLGVAVGIAPRTLELRVGPLRDGTAERLFDLTTDVLGRASERLTDDRRVTPSACTEMLALRLLDEP